jgi:hypothetical protein
VIDLDPGLKRQCIQRFKALSTHGVFFPRPGFDPNRESEIASEIEWRQLLPITDHPSALRVCERAMAAAKDFPACKRSSREDSNPRPVRPRESPMPTPRNEVKRVIPVAIPGSMPIPLAPPAVGRKSPTAPNPQTSRAVILATEARIQQIDARERHASARGSSIFTFFDPSKRECLMLETEERNRIQMLKKQSQKSGLITRIVNEIRRLFLDGRTPAYEGGATLVAFISQTFHQSNFDEFAVSDKTRSLSSVCIPLPIE